MIFFRKAMAALPLLAFAGTASAHVGAPEAGILSGAAHPFSGADHVLAMLAVGLWAAQTGGHARWALPTGFLVSMAIGGALGIAGVNGFIVEPLILASVICLGAAAALALRASLAAALPAVALFGAAHGIAHGADGAAAGASYVAGFLLATAALHATGLILGRLALGAGAGRLLRTMGGVTAVAGLGLAVA